MRAPGKISKRASGKDVVHGTEMLSRHSQILRPSDIETEALPGYGTESRQELQTEGTRWTGDPEGMRAEAEGTIQGGNPATSDAPGFLKRSSAQRPTFTIDPENGPRDRKLQARDRKPPVFMREKGDVHGVHGKLMERAEGVLRGGDAQHTSTAT